GDTSAIAVFCKGINSATKETDFLKHANFDPKTDGVTMANLQRQIDEKRKLDIPKKKAQLATERQNLSALKPTLDQVPHRFTKEAKQETNQLIKDIVEKKKIVAGLSVQSFDDGVLHTIGTPEWKALIDAAKELYESEKAANEDKDPEHCILCHQKLTNDARSLFQKYWQFLESKAEGELAHLTRRHAALLQDLRSAKTLY